MAGDWIPIETTLPGKPEIVRVAKSLGKSCDEIVGILVRFWVWAQAHTADGHLPGVTTEMLAEVVHVPHRFFGELQKVGWLSEAEGGLYIPNFERWLSRGAKRRLRECEKKRRQRSEAVVVASPSCPKGVPEMSRYDRDKNGTREEERREEKRRGQYLPAIRFGSESSIGLENDKEVGAEIERETLCESHPEDELSLVSGSAACDSHSSADEAFLVYPTKGTAERFILTIGQVARFEELYDGIDVRRELRKALAWIEAASTRRKTARGMYRFLVNWLNRAVDYGRHTPAPGNGHVERGFLEDRNLSIARAFLDAKRSKGEAGDG